MTTIEPNEEQREWIEHGIKMAKHALVWAADERGVEEAFNFFGEYLAETRKLEMFQVREAQPAEPTTITGFVFNEHCGLCFGFGWIGEGQNRTRCGCGKPVEPHNCESELEKSGRNTGYAQHGEEWVCSCGKKYIHTCDEAEGCQWDLVPAEPPAGEDWARQFARRIRTCAWSFEELAQNIRTAAEREAKERLLETAGKVAEYDAACELFPDDGVLPLYGRAKKVMEERERKARLDEAKWWHMQRGHHGWTKWCCERLAALAPKEKATETPTPNS